MKRAAAFLMLSLVLTACGDAQVQNADVTAALTPEEEAGRIEEIVEGCAREQIEDALAVAELLADLYGEQGLLPVLALGGLPTVTENQFVVPFTVDLDADGSIDGTGVLTLLDAQLNPTNPFDLETLLELLQGGLDVLPDLLAQLPDDTFVRISYVGVNLVVGSGRVDTRFVGGAPVGIAGTATAPGATCTTTLTWDEILLEGFTADGFPPLTGEITFESGDDVVSGDVRLDDTGMLSATLSLNDGTPFDYVIDLTTGEVTRS